MQNEIGDNEDTLTVGSDVQEGENVQAGENVAPKVKSDLKRGQHPSAAMLSTFFQYNICNGKISKIVIELCSKHFFVNE